jgi:hypothetical protein
MIVFFEFSLCWKCKVFVILLNGCGNDAQHKGVREQLLMALCLKLRFVYGKKHCCGVK